MSELLRDLTVLPAERREIARWLGSFRVSIGALLSSEGVRACGALDEGLSWEDAMAIPGFGLLVGACGAPRCFATAVDLASYAGTLRNALLDLVEHVPAPLQSASFRLHEGRELAMLMYDVPHVEPVTARFCAETVLSLALRIVRTFVPATTRCVLSLRRPAMEDDSALRAILGCELRYDAAYGALRFPRSLLDEPNVFANLELYGLYKSHAAWRHRTERDTEQLHVRVKSVLRYEADLSCVNAAVMARRFNVSPRWFRRRLGIEGRSLTELTDEVRREIALEALTKSAMPIKQITERLGFSEVTAFHRAFRRWTGGLTPARVRLAAREQAAPLESEHAAVG